MTTKDFILTPNRTKTVVTYNLDLSSLHSFPCVECDVIVNELSSGNIQIKFSTKKEIAQAIIRAICNKIPSFIQGIVGEENVMYIPRVTFSTSAGSTTFKTIQRKAYMISDDVLVITEKTININFSLDKQPCHDTTDENN